MDIARPATRFSLRRHRWILVGLAAAVAALILVQLGAWGRMGVPSVQRDRVWIDTVRKGTLTRQARGPGVLAPEEVWWIAAASDARVEQVLLRAGAKVEVDTIILRLGNPELDYAARQAKLDLAAEEAVLQDLPGRLETQLFAEMSTLVDLAGLCRRLKIAADADRDLFDTGSVAAAARAESAAQARDCEERHSLAERKVARMRVSSKTQVSAQQARVDSLRASHQLRERQLELLTVRAGNAGVLQDMLVEVGQQVTSGSTLAKVARPDRLKAVLKISEGEARDLAPGQPVTVDLRTATIKGKVARVEPAVRESSISVDVNLEGPLPPDARPDLSVDGIVDFERVETLLMGRPVASQDAIRPGVTMSLFRLEPDGSSARRTKVTLGRTSVNAAEVLAGLKPGDRVILSGLTGFEGVNDLRIR